MHGQRGDDRGGGRGGPGARRARADGPGRRSGTAALSAPDDPRAVLARHGLGAKKSWGQNFLVDRGVHARIVRAAALAPDDVVVEIGAGLGTLTAALAHAELPPARIIAVERDPDMLAVLRAELGSEPRVVIHPGDAAAFDYHATARQAGRPLVIVGNLPYQITSALLFGLVDAGDAVARAIVMVQREVADRIVAPPGDKVYGRLTVMLGQALEPRLLFGVPPGAFHPRPKVTSAILSLVRRPAPLAPTRDPVLFARLVKAAFGTRRKMLRRSLGDAFGADVAARALDTGGVAGTRRPEELTIAELARISDALSALGVTAEI